ncbi:MAG: Proprionate catabolism activator, Fis family [Clostridiales bacterium]|jgi:PAS domain S-box-containing protein|nr:Proprionate catabolism activator, Fis family [Clostridiales bacterium]
MIKITLIVPYQELIDHMIKTFNEHNKFISALKNGNSRNVYKLETILATADEVMHLKLDADVVISRGATAEILRDSDHSIPLVEIPLAGNDLIRCLHEVRELYGLKKVGVIGPMNMIFGAEGLSDIIGMKIKTYLLENHDKIPKVVEKAVNDGCEVIVGGSRTSMYATSKGIIAAVPRTGRDSLWQAITEAKRVAQISRVEQEKAQLFKTILDYAYEGVIAVDKKNAISVFNESARKILGIGKKDPVGRKYNEIIPKSRLNDLFEAEGERLDDIIVHNEIQLAINKVPIILKNENVGNVVTFQNATKIQELEGKIRQKIYTRGHIAKHSFDDIIGKSEKIKSTIETAKRFSRVDSNILIIGETGTGKELFAQSIHNFSPRKMGPFVAVNCAALPESLLESELFGYVEGAFTGAAKGGKPGLFELAHKGTIFLDEIGELSLKLQGRLLRVLQEKEIMRLGHDRVIPVDVRIISATNKDLGKMEEKGDFREDLYYRLNVLKLNLPSLNKRKEDIPLIVENFMCKYAHLSDFSEISITDHAKRLLSDFEWPGNIRELGNVCERLLVLSRSSIVDEKIILEAILDHEGSSDVFSAGNPINIGTRALNHYSEPKKEITNSKENIILSKIVKKQIDEDIGDLERQKIREALEKEGYFKTRAAKRLGITRVTLWRKMKDLNMI